MTLLNITYKLYTNVFQICLYLVLVEIIFFDQFVFLSMQFILDNIFLIHETIDLTENSKQLLIFSKLDFSKMYNMVDWSIFFFKPWKVLDLHTSL